MAAGVINGASSVQKRRGSDGKVSDVYLPFPPPPLGGCVQRHVSVVNPVLACVTAAALERFEPCIGFTRLPSCDLVSPRAPWLSFPHAVLTLGSIRRHKRAT